MWDEKILSVCGNRHGKRRSAGSRIQVQRFFGDAAGWVFSEISLLLAEDNDIRKNPYHQRQNLLYFLLGRRTSEVGLFRGFEGRKKTFFARSDVFGQ